MDAPTDRAKLVEAALVPHVAEASLHAYLRRHRAAGMSWRAIANDVSYMSGIEVTDVTLASWYPDLREPLTPQKRRTSRAPARKQAPDQGRKT